jgi:hypothetical protein
MVINLLFSMKSESAELIAAGCFCIVFGIF